MAKTLKFTVSSAFAHDGKIYTPKKSIELSEREAKPLLERGKIAPARGAAGPEKDNGASGGGAKTSTTGGGNGKTGGDDKGKAAAK